MREHLFACGRLAMLGTSAFGTRLVICVLAKKGYGQLSRDDGRPTPASSEYADDGRVGQLWPPSLIAYTSSHLLDLDPAR